MTDEKIMLCEKYSKTDPYKNLHKILTTEVDRVIIHNIIKIIKNVSPDLEPFYSKADK